MFSLQTKVSMIKALLTKKSPFYVQFYISNKCYLKCKMCNIVEANKMLEPFKTEDIGRIADNLVRIGTGDRKSTRLNSSHIPLSRMPSSA